MCVKVVGGWGGEIRWGRGIVPQNLNIQRAGLISLGYVKLLVGSAESAYGVRWMPSFRGWAVGNPKLSRAGELTPRVRHGYGKTRGDLVTGITGTGTVLGFGTPRHTVYPYHGITGISRVYYDKVDLIFTFFLLVFSWFFFSSFNLSHCDTAKYGHASCAYILIFLLSSSHTHAQ
jgi:hypothetical protein